MMSGLGKGLPGDMEPAVAGQELVGIFPRFEEIHQSLELIRILWADVGSLTKKVLGVLDTTYLAVDLGITIAGIDDDGADDQPCRFQQLITAVGQIDDILHRRDVLRIFPQIEELAQLEMRRESHIIIIHGHSCFIHGNSR